VDPVQTTAGYAVPDSARTKSDLKELPKGDYAVLPRRDRNDQAIDLAPPLTSVGFRPHGRRFPTIVGHGAMVAKP
jgi:hypothetical protein